MVPIFEFSIFILLAEFVYAGNIRRVPKKIAIDEEDLKEEKARRHPFVMCSDADRRSQTERYKWDSLCLTGFLSFIDEKPILDWGFTRNYSTRFNNAGKGMELSDVLKYRGEYLAPDDKTGLVYKLRADSAIPWVYLGTGDGNSELPLKTEWMTLKDGLIYAGSIGIETYDENGKAIHHNEMFIKKITPYGNVIHMDWRDRFRALSRKIGIEWPGYVTYEAVRWSDIHKKWFLTPRQVSLDQTRDNKRGSNIMLITSDCFCDIEILEVGRVNKLHGFSTFDFIPGTNDQLIMAVKSEEIETLYKSFVMIFDIQGRVLLDETEIPVTGQKFEGLTFLFPNDRIFLERQ